MPNALREKILLDRYVASGGKLNTTQLNAPFSFIVRPSATPKVDPSRISNGFEDGVVALLRDAILSTPLSGIAIFPRIIDPAAGSLPDSKSYKRGEKSFFVGLNIPYQTWLSATHDQQVDLMAANIVASIECVPAKYFTDEDRAKLIAMVESIRQQLLAGQNVS